MAERVRHAILLVGAVGCLAYAFVQGNPAWIGAAGGLLGGDLLVRAGKEVK